MDVNETLVKERFDAAVGKVSPDVVSLVGGGVAAGRGIRRQRRLVGAAAVAAASVLVVGVVTATGGFGDVFGSKGAGPADGVGTVSQLEPATPRGLAAAVMSHTSVLGTPTRVVGSSVDEPPRSPSGQPQVMAQLGYRTSSGIDVVLQVVASSDVTSVLRDGLCIDVKPPDTCTQTTLPDGTIRAVVEASDPARPSSSSSSSDRAGSGSASGSGSNAGSGQPSGSGAHMLAVAIVRADALVVAIETVPTSGEAPLSATDLQEIAADPAVGLQTTAAFNAQGQDIPDFVSDPTALGGGSSSSSGASAAATASAPAATAPPPGPIRRTPAHRQTVPGSTLATSAATR